MVFSKSFVAVVFGVVFIAATSAYANDDPEDVKRRVGNGNPANGKAKAAKCKICHGETGDTVEPVIPKLAGQYANYIESQIFNFQEGTLRDPSMTQIAKTLTNRRDLEDIAAYFASQNQMKGRPGTNEEGEKLYVDKGCLNCHGEIGKGKPSYNAIFPIIGGQNRGYLIKQMKDFKSGARTTDISGIMGLVANQMTYSEIVAVAEYLSAQ
jgi:cytochrome c553